jgi:hypothetical protein
METTIDQMADTEFATYVLGQSQRNLDHVLARYHAGAAPGRGRGGGSRRAGVADGAGLLRAVRSTVGRRWCSRRTPEGLGRSRHPPTHGAY